MTTFNTLLNDLYAAKKSDNYRQIQKALKACRDTECSFEQGHYEVWLLLLDTKLTSKKTVLKELCRKVLRKEADRRRGQRNHYKQTNHTKQKETKNTEQKETWVTYYNEFINSTPAEAKRAYRRYQMKHYSAACQGNQKSKELMQIINKARDEYQKEMEYRAKYSKAA